MKNALGPANRAFPFTIADQLTSSVYHGVDVPIPTLPLANTVNMFAGDQKTPFPISNILSGNHILYCPIARLLSLLAIVDSHIATELCQLAIVWIPIANE